MDALTNLLITLKNNEAAAKGEVIARPTSKLATEVLRIMQRHGYVGEFEIIDDGKGQVYKVQLLHKVNNCGAIKPRFPVKNGEIQHYERRFLPAQSFGIIMLSSSKGLLTHDEAKKKGLGGRLIAFVY